MPLNVLYAEAHDLREPAPKVGKIEESYALKPKRQKRSFIDRVAPEGEREVALVIRRQRSKRHGLDCGEASEEFICS